jgi:hypothetical protein
MTIMVEYPVPHSEVEQARHNPAVRKILSSRATRPCSSVPPIPVPVMIWIKAATGKAFVRTLCDGVPRNGLQSRGASRGVDQIIVPRPAPLKHGAAVLSELGLREDGTMRRSVADRRLHGASPSMASTISSLTNRGHQSAKRAPILGRCFDPSHSRNLRLPI